MIDNINAIKNTIDDLINYQQQNLSSFVNEVYSTRRIIELAKELEKEEELRIKKLEEDGPSVHITNEGDVIVTLLRNNKELFHNFGESHITIESTNDDELISNFMINGDKEEDGFIYFILVKSAEIPPFGIHISSKEAVILNERIVKKEHEYLYH